MSGNQKRGKELLPGSHDSDFVAPWESVIFKRRAGFWWKVNEYVALFAYEDFCHNDIFTDFKFEVLTGQNQKIFLKGRTLVNAHGLAEPVDNAAVQVCSAAYHMMDTQILWSAVCDMYEVSKAAQENRASEVTVSWESKNLRNRVGFQWKVNREVTLFAYEKPNSDCTKRMFEFEVLLGWGRKVFFRGYVDGHTAWDKTAIEICTQAYRGIRSNIQNLWSAQYQFYETYMEASVKAGTVIDRTVCDELMYPRSCITTPPKYENSI